MEELHNIPWDYKQFQGFMFDKGKEKSKEIKKQQDHNSLVQFFDLLLKIDMRQNPELYKVNNRNENND